MRDYFDNGVVDKNCGRQKQIHEHFNNFLRERYFEMEKDALSFEDFYQMSEQFFEVSGLPVIFRDILYNLLGYIFAMGADAEETVAFYSRLVKEHLDYVKKKEDTQFYMEQGLSPNDLDIATFIFDDRNAQGGRN